MMAGGLMIGGMIGLGGRGTGRVCPDPPPLLPSGSEKNIKNPPPPRRGRAFLAEPHPDLSSEEVTRLFFRFPNRSEDGRTKPEDWKREFALEAPIGLIDLFASAGHRALTSLWRLTRGG